MAEYRLYCLDGAGRISLAEWIDADSDQEAIAKARQIEHGAIKCEVWQRNRLVARLSAQDLAD
jgi:hypothetical protein